MSILFSKDFWPPVRRLILGALLAALGWAQAPPRIFYSDLESGPNTGGENDKGVYVTIYGKNFGAAQGSSTVTVGGGLADNYPVWSDSRITFQLGSKAATGQILVTTSPGSSNGIPFTIRPGGIFFVSNTGRDSNNGSFGAPWKTLTKAVASIPSGGTIYAMNGVSQTTVQTFSAALYPTTGGTSAAYNALIAYPGATVQVGDPGVTTGIYLTQGLSTHGGPYWVFAGLTLRGKSEAVRLSSINHVRIVGCDVSCPNGDGSTGCVDYSAGLTGTGEYFWLLGNDIHDVSQNLSGGSSKLYHDVYFSTDSNHAVVAWNHIHDSKACRSIQFHSSPLGGSTGFNQFDISIHDNLIHDNPCDGINLATVDPSKGPVEVYNNVIYHVGAGPTPPDGTANYACIYVQGGTNNGPPPQGEVDVFNNTCYDAGSIDATVSGSGLWAGPNSSISGFTVRLQNNIFYSLNGERYLTKSLLQSGAPNSLIGSNNLWFGSGPAPGSPTQLTGNLNADPLFVNPGAFDFHLQSASPAIDAGTATKAAIDFDGVTRPQGASYDIGALEFSQGGGTVPSVSLSSVTCNPLTLTSGASSTCTVSLSQAAPSGGMTVTLASSGGTVTIPSSVTVPAGAASAGFQATAGTIPYPASASISAVAAGVIRTVTLTLQSPVQLFSLACSPAAVTGGTPVSCNLTLTAPAPTGGLAVNSAGNNGVVSVPSSITVPAKSTTVGFLVGTSAVGAQQSVALTATLSGQSVTALLLVLPPGLQSLSCASATVLIPGSVPCTVGLSGPAATPGITVGLAASGVSLPVPATVNIPAGANVATFTASAPAGASPGPSTLTATLGGTSQTFVLGVGLTTPSVVLSCSSTILVGGGRATCSVTITPPAPTGAGVALASSNPLVTVPASVQVPAGGTAQFTLISALILSDQAALITASLGDAVQTQGLQLMAIKPLGLSCSPATVTDGGNTTCQVSLNAAAPSPVALNLSSSGPVAGVPATVAFRPGQSSLAFVVVTNPAVSLGSAQQSVVITAGLGAASAQGTINVVAPSAPILALPGTQVGIAGTAIRFTVSAVDPSGSPVILSAANLPQGAQFDAGTDGFNWTPNVLQLGTYKIHFTATNSLQASSAGDVTIMVVASKPALSAVVNSASYSEELACSPGAIASLFGTALSPGPLGAAQLPLPTELSGVHLKINGDRAPLFYVSPTQVNFQCPRLPPGAPLTFVMDNSAGTSPPIPVTMQYATPGIYTLYGSGQGQGAITLAGTSTFVMVRNPVAPSQPAEPGDYVSIFATGLGPVDNPPPAGQPASGDTLSRVQASLQVLVGDIPAEVQFAGLTPGLVGLYQANIKIPDNAPLGPDIPVSILIPAPDGRVLRSNIVTMAIEAAF